MDAIKRKLRQSSESVVKHGIILSWPQKVKLFHRLIWTVSFTKSKVNYEVFLLTGKHILESRGQCDKKRSNKAKQNSESPLIDFTFLSWSIV